MDAKRGGRVSERICKVVKKKERTALDINKGIVVYLYLSAVLPKRMLLNW